MQRDHGWQGLGLTRAESHNLGDGGHIGLRHETPPLAKGPARISCIRATKVVNPPLQRLEEMPSHPSGIMPPSRCPFCQDELEKEESECVWVYFKFSECWLKPSCLRLERYEETWLLNFSSNFTAATLNESSQREQLCLHLSKYLEQEIRGDKVD